MIATQFYNQYFVNRNFGLGSAIAVVLLVAVSPFVVYNLRQFREREVSMTAANPRESRLPHVVVNGTLLVICLLWLVPTFGLFISSFRTRDDILTTGWWTILPHREWVTVEEFTPPPEIDRNQPMTFEGVTGTFAEFRTGMRRPDGQRVLWIGNKRAGRVQVQERRWAGLPRFHAAELP